MLWSLGSLATPAPAVLWGVLGLTAGFAGVSLAAAYRDRRRHRPWGRGTLGLALAGLVAAVLFPLAVLVPSPRVTTVPATSASATPAATLRIVSFNVLHGYPTFPDQGARATRLVAALAALQPDILVLQESWRTRRHGRLAERLARKLGLHLAYARANGSERWIGFEEGSAILSRWPIRRAVARPLEPRASWAERRIALSVRLGTPEGCFDVLGLHLTNRGPRVADRQAASAALLVDPRCFTVVAGDFNRPSGSPALATFLRRGFEESLPGDIDHLLVPAGPSPWRLGRVRQAFPPTRPGALSDHAALVVDLVRLPRKLLTPQAR